MRRLAEARDITDGYAQAARIRPSRCETNGERAGLDSEEVGVEGTVVRCAHDEAIPGIIAAAIRDGDHVGSIENIQHPDLAERTRRAVPPEDVKTEPSLPHSLRCRPHPLLGGLDG